MRYGAVCDVSALVNAETFKRACSLVRGSLYLPASTYCWLARDKLIGVRTHEIRYSFASRLVGEGRLLVLYLPELLDELARRLLFTVDRGVPLTDLRALMLGAHLGLPVVFLDPEFRRELVEHLGARSLGWIKTDGSWASYGRAVGHYRRLRNRVAALLASQLGNGGRLEEVEKTGEANRGQGVECFVLDLLPVLNEYVVDRVLQHRVIRELCRQAVVAVLDGTEKE